MKHTELPEDYALVLQQIGEDGGDDIATLAEALRYDRRRLAHIIQALHHKGLLVINTGMYHESWLSLSAKGKRLMAYLWPESRLQYGY